MNKYVIETENLTKDYHGLIAGVFPVSAPQPSQDFQVFPCRQIFIKSRGLNNRANAVTALFFKNGMIFTEKIQMKQRPGLAAAVMHEPELLILDEPMNSLDPVGIHETRKYLLQLCREKANALLMSALKSIFSYKRSRLFPEMA